MIARFVLWSSYVPPASFVEKRPPSSPTKSRVGPLPLKKKYASASYGVGFRNAWLNSKEMNETPPKLPRGIPSLSWCSSYMKVP